MQSVATRRIPFRSGIHGVQGVASSNLVAPTNTYGSVVPTVVPIPNDAFQGDTLGQHEQRLLGGDLECSDLGERRADESFNSSGRCIADPRPDDFWWRAVHQRQTPKIIVLGDHREIMLACIGPDLQIGRTGKAKQVDMGAVGELISLSAN
jgi:hypothetical protein